MDKPIVITAGHSNTDPGAVADYNKDKIYEYKEASFVVLMRNIVAFCLKRDGFTVKTDGEYLINAPLSEAVKLIKGSAVAVEFHLNASSNPDVFGVEVLSQPKDKDLSQKIANSVVKVTKSKLRGENGWKPENAGQHSRLAFVRNGGIIVELEFVSNKKAMDVLSDKVWLVGREIADTIKSYVEALN